MKDDGSGHTQTKVSKVTGVGQREHLARGLLSDAEVVLVHHVTLAALDARVRPVAVAALARFVTGQAGEGAFSVGAELVSGAWAFILWRLSVLLLLIQDWIALVQV